MCLCGVRSARVDTSSVCGDFDARYSDERNDASVFDRRVRANAVAKLLSVLKHPGIRITTAKTWPGRKQ
jgi:hypothetical protein